MCDVIYELLDTSVICVTSFMISFENLYFQVRSIGNDPELRRSLRLAHQRAQRENIFSHLVKNQIFEGTGMPNSNSLRRFCLFLVLKNGEF